MACALALLLAVPATAGKSTYTRRFVNRTSVPIAYFKAIDGVWAYQFTVYPGFTNELRDTPKRSDMGRDLWGADIGCDYLSVDMTRNDFGTYEWVWKIGESVPR